jgi:hypothetical protein
VEVGRGRALSQSSACTMRMSSNTIKKE